MKWYWIVGIVVGLLILGLLVLKKNFSFSPTGLKSGGPQSRKFDINDPGLPIRQESHPPALGGYTK